MKALKPLNCFQSAVELLVVALDEIGSFRTAVVMEIFCLHIACQQIAVVEDVLQCADLQRIVIVSGRSPSDVAFEVRLSEVRQIEDLVFEIFQECSVRFVAAYLQCSADVLQEMHVAKLDDDTGVDSSCRHADGFIVIADESKQFVAGILELYEKLQQRLVVLTWSQHADRNVMREVIDTVEERNFLLISFHGDELPINNEEAAESLGIAVAERHLVVVRQSFQLCHETPVGRIDALADLSGQRPNACALEMGQEQGCFRLPVIDTETLPAILAAVALQSSPMTIPFRVERVTGFAGNPTAS